MSVVAERIFVEQPVGEHPPAALYLVATPCLRLPEDILIGEECYVKKMPAIRGIYRGMAEWVGKGIAEIETTTNSAYIRRGASFLVPYSALLRYEV